MGKSTLIKIGIGAAIIGAAFLTGGASLLPSIAATSSTVAGVTVATTALGAALSTTALGAMALAAGASIALSGVSQAFAKTPSVSLSQIDRLNASMVPSAPRKMVFGQTAMATDIRYVEPSGDNQEYIDYIIAVASHAVQSIDEIWFEDTLAWRAVGDVQGKYRNYLSVNPVLEGSAANTIQINGGGKWGSSRRLTGCAYIHLRIKRTGNGKKAESPFSGGLPSRMTIVGCGAKLYDPRRDSTVVGGSGPMRANDQSTWRYVTADGATIGENLTLQALWYLLGWRINGKLAVGRGLPPARLDLAEWIEAANLADEQVGLAAGGTQVRYAGAGVASEGDDPGSILQTFAGGCNGRFRDGGGKLSLTVMHNDLAAAATDDGLGDDDVLSPFTWNPDPALEQTYNIVRGRYTDPSSASLYQLVDYPEVRIASPDGIDRVLTLDLPMIEDAARAQRIAKQVLQRKQYDRTFTATFGARAWAYQVGDVLPFTFSPLGFDRMLFRVAEQQPTMDGTCPMVLTVEHSQIYAWDRDDSAAVVAAEPIRYDPLNNAIILAVDQAGRTAEWPAIIGVDKPEDRATVGATIGVNLKGAAGRLVFPDEILNEAISLSPTGELLIATRPAGKINIELAGGASAAALKRVGDALAALDVHSAGRFDADAGARQFLADAVDRLAETMARVALDGNRTREILRDAGISIDPASGTARIFAIDQAARSISKAEIRLSAAEGNIGLRVTRAEMTDAIARAAIDPSQVAELGDLQARLTSAEVDIDAIDAAVRLKADQILVGALGGRVTDVQADLDAVTGQLLLKANSATVTGLESRITSAEATLTALGDVASYVQQVTATRFVAAAAEAAQEDALRALLAGDGARRQAITLSASARQDLVAKIVDNDSAQARAATALAVRIAGNEATLQQDRVASVGRDTAIAADVIDLTAQFRDNKALVGQTLTALADADGAVAQRTAQLEARAGAADADRATITARIGRAELTAANATSAVARDLSSLSTRYDVFSASASQSLTSLSNATGSLSERAAALEARAGTGDADRAAISARIGRVETAAADATGAVARDVSSLTANFNGFGAAVSENLIALAGVDTLLSGRIGTVSTTVEGHTATITSHSSSIGGLSLRNGVELNANGYITGFVQNNDGRRGDFLILADRFAVGSPGNPTSVPFQVLDGISYLKTAVIRDATIGTLKILDDSITRRVATQLTSTVTGDGTTISVLSLTVDLPYGGKVIINGTGSHTYSGPAPNFAATLTHNGAQLNAGTGGGAGAVTTSFAITAFKTVPPGQHVFEQRWFGGSSSIQLPTAVLIVDAALK